MRGIASGVSILLAAWACPQAQPTPAPTSGDAPCEEWPREAVEPDLSRPDSEGFYPLFNGVDFSGWWHNCRTQHSAGTYTQGAIFRVDTARKAIFSTQRGSSTGGVLMTKAKFMDYELVFDFWPGWDNQDALENRADTLGRAYNTTLNYTGSACMGGVWGESGLVSRDFRPFAFNDRRTLTIPGLNGTDERNNWTLITRKLKAAGEIFPCPDSGCTQEDWRNLWDFDGWNQIRVVFRGGKNPADPIHARSWFRKVGAIDWVPVSVDTTLLMEIKPGYIGLMVHLGGPYGSPRGTWYRNIRWKPLVPSTSTAVRGKPEPASHRPAIRIDRVRQEIRIAIGESVPSRDVRIFSFDGKSRTEMRGIRGATRISTAGWRRGVYLLRVGEGTKSDWTPFLIP